MGKDCQCAQETDKMLNKSTYDFAALLRVVIVALLLAAVFNCFAYYVTPQHYIAQNVITVTNILIVLGVVLTCRTVFMGTCCLPDLQLTATQIQSIHATRNTAAEGRILNNRMVYAKRLSEALQIPTVSYDAHDPTQPAIDYEQFVKIRVFIEVNYPLVHKHLTRELINTHSLVFHWKSTAPTAAQLKPYCLTAHLDVVPTPDEGKWTHPPFSGHIDEEYIWGRGAIDDKQNVFSILEAIEDILQHNPEFTPSRDIYLAFGSDEEISGWNGAAKIAEYFLEKLGPNCFEALFDEGLFIMDGVMPGHKKPIAFVCIAEKGAVDLELTVEVDPGHASTPPHESAIGILSKAVTAIETNPMPPQFDGVTQNIFESVRGGFTGALKFVMCNLWLFAPILAKILAAGQHTATMVKTTAAVTIFKAGNKINVLPGTASVCINHRIHPNDTVEAVIAHNHKVINDPRVKIKQLSSLQPAPVSDHNHEMFKNITKAIYQTFDDICNVVPGTFVANSDSRHYHALTKEIFRFNPILLNKEEIKMFHGFDEKIRIDSYAKLVYFWRNVIYLNNVPEQQQEQITQAKKVD